MGVGVGSGVGSIVGPGDGTGVVGTGVGAAVGGAVKETEYDASEMFLPVAYSVMWLHSHVTL